MPRSLVATDVTEVLMKALEHDLMPMIKEQGKAAVREIVMQGNKQGIALAEMPYLFWALANQKELPDLGPRQKVFQVMLDIMVRMGVMPNYQKNFKVTNDLEVDAAVDATVQHMGVWAAKDMIPALMVGYYKVLTQHAPKVPSVTKGQVPASNGVGYLNALLREILTLRSAWFDDGELLRRVVRLLPEW